MELWKCSDSNRLLGVIQFMAQYIYYKSDYLWTLKDLSSIVIKAIGIKRENS